MRKTGYLETLYLERASPREEKSAECVSWVHKTHSAAAAYSDNGLRPSRLSETS
jgi:hypothetical protein